MIEGKKSARNVGLRVIIAVDFDLAAENQRVPSSDHVDAGREVPLGVVIGDEALSLRTRDVRGHVLYARRGRRPHDGGYDTVKGCRPADRGQIKSGVLRRAIISEAANAEVQIGARSGAEVHVVVKNARLGVDCLGALAEAQASPQRIDGKIEQVPVAEAEKQALVLGNILVDAENRLVVISASTGSYNIIVVYTRSSGLGVEIQERSRCRVLFTERNNVVGGEFLPDPGCGVRCCRVVDSDGIPGLVGERGKVPVPLCGSRNVGGEHLSLAEPKPLPADEPECLVLDQAPTG